MKTQRLREARSHYVVSEQWSWYSKWVPGIKPKLTTMDCNEGKALPRSASCLLTPPTSSHTTLTLALCTPVPSWWPGCFFHLAKSFSFPASWPLHSLASLNNQSFLADCFSPADCSLNVTSLTPCLESTSLPRSPYHNSHNTVSFLG